MTVEQGDQRDPSLALLLLFQSQGRNFKLFHFSVKKSPVIYIETLRTFLRSVALNAIATVLEDRNIVLSALSDPSVRPSQPPNIERKLSGFGAVVWDPLLRE